VPKAEILAFLPKGFAVSIPDSPGVKLFAFHGNVNTNLGSLEGGKFSKDVLQPENGFWIFKDTTTQLKVGDVINYWLFVEKDGLGYRQDLQKFVVKELRHIDEATTVAEDVIVQQLNQQQSTVLSGDIHHHHHYYNENSSTYAAHCPTVDQSLEKISNQLNVVLEQIKSLHDKTEPLKNKIDSLEEVIGELLKGKDNGTKLLLIGHNPPYDSNVYEAIRGVIIDRLDLHDLSSSIKFAKLEKNGIMFELKTSIEKQRILLRAQERFNTDKRKIVNYSSNEERKLNSEVPEVYFRTSDKELHSDESQSNINDRILFL